MAGPSENNTIHIVQYNMLESREQVILPDTGIKRILIWMYLYISFLGSFSRFWNPERWSQNSIQRNKMQSYEINTVIE